MSQKTCFILATVICVCSVQSVQATSIPINNSSFESGGVFPNPADGWTTTGTTGTTTLMIPSQFDSGPSDGSGRFLFTNSSGAIAYQDIAYSIQPGDVFTLSAELGKRKGTTHTFTSVSIELWANDGVNLTNLITKSVDAADVPLGSFSAFSDSYVEDGTHAGSTLRVLFRVTGGLQPAMDVVNLDATAVPEPLSAGLLLIGGASCLLFHRRTRLYARSPNRLVAVEVST